MVEYMQAGPDSSETVLDDIDASWPDLVPMRQPTEAAGGAAARRPLLRFDVDPTGERRRRTTTLQRGGTADRREPRRPWGDRRLPPRVLGAGDPDRGVLPLWVTFDFLRDETRTGSSSWVAILVGVVGVFFLLLGDEPRVDLLPEFREGVRPYVFVGPALVILACSSVYPVINTIMISLKDAHRRRVRRARQLPVRVHRRDMLRAIRNTAGWIILVPLVAVSIGLAFATLADRLRRGEALAKSLIFLPMAISFVGAASRCRLIYSFRPEGLRHQHRAAERDHDRPRQGAGRVAVQRAVEQPPPDGDHGVDADRVRHGRALGAIKSIPDEIIEAARIDGASELQVFTHHRAEHPPDDRRGDHRTW